MIKLYKTGKDFLDENLSLILSDPLGTIFFEVNANAIERCNENSYAARVECGDEVLIAIRLDGYPLVLSGSERCVEEFAKVAWERKLQFDKVLGYYDLSDKFLTCYEQHAGGSHKVNLSMDVMYCDKVVPCDTSGVERATADDVEEIARLYVAFLNEALRKNETWGGKIAEIAQEIDNYALWRIDGEIVSMASRKNSGSGLCRISNVFTKLQHRNKGYSRKIVTYLTERIRQNGDLPCLFVDKSNPVSNHLYRKIGYKYDKSRYEIDYIPDENSNKLNTKI